MPSQPVVAAFATGHAIGVATNERANNSRALLEELDHDVQVSTHAIHEFFAEFLPNLGLFVLIVIVLSLLFGVLILAVGFLLRQCRVPENCSRLTVYILGIIFGIVVLATAFGAVGIDFSQLFLGFGLISIAFSAGLSDVIGNAVAGVLLQTTDISELHQRIGVAGYSGEIVAMNLRHVEIRPDAKSGNAYVGDDTTILIPNSILERSPVTVSWKGLRGPRLGSGRGLALRSTGFSPMSNPTTTFGAAATSTRPTPALLTPSLGVLESGTSMPYSALLQQRKSKAAAEASTTHAGLRQRK